MGVVCMAIDLSHPTTLGWSTSGFHLADRQCGGEGEGGCLLRGHSDNRPFASLQCWDGVRRVLTYQAGIAGGRGGALAL